MSSSFNARAVQGAIYADGAYGRLPRVPVEPDLLAAKAEKHLTPEAWWYVAGSAGQQRTAKANTAAFDRYPIVPRMLRDVKNRSLGVELFGHSYSSPLLFAPIGVLEMAHPQAERAVGRAAKALNIPMVLSTQGSTPMEVTSAELGESPMWYQLYWSNNDDFARSLVQRAEKCGAHAIVVTLDTHCMGWRVKDLDLGFLPFARGMGIAQYTSDPVFTDLVNDRIKNKVASALPKQSPTLGAIWTLASIIGHYPGRLVDKLFSGQPRAAVDTFLDTFPCPSLTWADIAKLRAWTTLPIVLKGIQHPDDALLALEHGVDGISVSNHGGRQVDGAIASLDALDAIARVVKGKVPIIFDSGIRSGADVFKALALGADAVMVGRPWLFGLAIDGADGAKAVMERILAELDFTMSLSGVSSVKAIGRECVVVPKEPLLALSAEKKDQE